LREDRRHIQDRDIYLLKQIVTTHLNMEIAATTEITNIAIDVLPYMVTLVPEQRQELTTEGGLQVREKERELAKVVANFRDHNILVSLFIDPDINEIKAAKRIGATHVELHTGYYANAAGPVSIEDELGKVKDASIVAVKLGLHLNAGHGLNYQNVTPVAQIEGMEELNIGHSIVGRASLVGMEAAVRDMLALI
jgi:pyridoxine 5-phosphate synthase